MKIGMGRTRVELGMGTHGKWSAVYYFQWGLWVVWLYDLYDFDLRRWVVDPVVMVAGHLVFMVGGMVV